MTSLPDTLAATLARIEAMGLSPHEYDVPAVLDSIVGDGVDLADVNDADFLYLLTRNALENRTGLPCPSWCERVPGHPFESYNPLTSRQTRPHGLILAAGEGVCIELTQEDEREQGDDSTGVLGATFVAVEVMGDLDAASLRQRAADLLNAADKLDTITGEAVRSMKDPL